MELAVRIEYFKYPKLNLREIIREESISVIEKWRNFFRDEYPWLWAGREGNPHGLHFTPIYECAETETRKRSIRVVVDETLCPQWIWLEEGVKPHTIRARDWLGYMRIDADRTYIPVDRDAIYTKEVRHPGMSPQNLRKAFMSRFEREIIHEIEEQVSEMLK